MCGPAQLTFIMNFVAYFIPNSFFPTQSCPSETSLSSNTTDLMASPEECVFQSAFCTELKIDIQKTGVVV